MRKAAVTLFTLVLLVALSGCATTSVRQHPDFASGERKIKVVAILPVEVEYRHLVFTGENERDAEREQSIAREIESGMSVVLQRNGYVAKTDVLDKARSGDKEFNFQLEQLNGAFVQVAKELYAQPMVQVEQSNKFKVGVGPLANTFSAIAGADALVLTRYQGFDKSSGLMTKEVFSSVLFASLTGSISVPAKRGGQIELSLIDGVTGEILWSNTASGPVGAFANLENAMAKLPPAQVTTASKVDLEEVPTAAVQAEAAQSKTQAKKPKAAPRSKLTEK